MSTVTQAVQQQIAARKTLLEEKKGWREFVYASEYYGNKDFDGHFEILYLFHPEVDFRRWRKKSFSHGGFSECKNNTCFNKWLKKLPPDRYTEVPRVSGKLTLDIDGVTVYVSWDAESPA